MDIEMAMTQGARTYIAKEVDIEIRVGKEINREVKTEIVIVTGI
jgi:hypothetical protein